MKNLFVGNLSFQTTENELRSIFEAFGDISRLQLITDRDTGQSRGFAFVEMPNDDEAANAIAALNGGDVGGRTLKVSEALPKAERTGSRFSGKSDRGGYSRDSNRGAAGRW